MTLCHLTLKAVRNPGSPITDPASYHTIGSECLREMCGAWAKENSFELECLDGSYLKFPEGGHCALVPRER